MFINVISAMVVSIGMFISSGRTEEGASASIQEPDDSFFRYKPIYGLSWNRGLFYVISTIFMSALLSIISLNYTDTISILICMCAGLLFGLFLLNKVFTVLQP
jgi:hypothetical protein